MIDFINKQAIRTIKIYKNGYDEGYKQGYAKGKLDGAIEEVGKAKEIIDKVFKND